MSAGRAYKKKIETMLKHFGKTIIVHKNFNTQGATSFEARGFNETEGGSKQVIFQFAEQLDISVGCVLQAKGSRDYWKVTDTEDIILDDVFISFDVRVEKINVDGEITRPSSSLGNIYNLQGTHSRVNISSQDQSLNISQQTSENVFTDIRQVIQTQIQNEGEKADILNKLDELEKSIGKKEFTEKYRDFIGTVADHISLIAIFIPHLTKMLGG
ncbi:MAG TPA: hypothetical protein VGC97_19610 [Pyrinomonadaceae bacterium]|jgi:hypothetical protein